MGKHYFDKKSMKVITEVSHTNKDAKMPNKFNKIVGVFFAIFVILKMELQISFIDKNESNKKDQ